MKKVAIFGAGIVGKSVFSVIGKENVYCFIDNNPISDTLFDVPCLTFNEYLKIKDETIVLVASFDYTTDMCNQLDMNLIFDYHICTRHSFSIFDTYRPRYLSIMNQQWFHYSYFDLIKNYELSKYQNITLYSYPENIGILMLVLEMAGIADKIKRVIPHTVIGTEKLSWTETQSQSDCIILAVKRNQSHLHDVIELESEKYDNGNLAVADFYKFYEFIEEFHCPEIEKFKDIHKGERVFLIGNGPSLTASDLDLLHKHNEICFGCNRIYMMFDKTEWRPNYYFIQDYHNYINFFDDINAIDVPVKFIEKFKYILDARSSELKGEIICPYINEPEEYYPNYPAISTEMTKGFPFLYSVVPDMMLHTALYMGFTEIYLLGLDNNTGIEKKVTHFYANGPSENEYGDFIVNKMNAPGKLNKAYEKVRLYSDKHGIKVYNVTRGGYLEAFERKNLEDLYQ